MQTIPGIITDGKCQFAESLSDTIDLKKSYIEFNELSVHKYSRLYKDLTYDINMVAYHGQPTSLLTETLHELKYGNTKIIKDKCRVSLHHIINCRANRSVIYIQHINIIIYDINKDIKQGKLVLTKASTPDNFIHVNTSTSLVNHPYPGGLTGFVNAIQHIPGKHEIMWVLFKVPSSENDTPKIDIKKKTHPTGFNVTTLEDLHNFTQFRRYFRIKSKRPIPDWYILEVPQDMIKIIASIPHKEGTLYSLIILHEDYY